MAENAFRNRFDISRRYVVSKILFHSNLLTIG
jgi:hypothetical protein